jgi:hypothetical protein
MYSMVCWVSVIFMQFEKIHLVSFFGELCMYRHSKLLTFSNGVSVVCNLRCPEAASLM